MAYFVVEKCGQVGPVWANFATLAEARSYVTDVSRYCEIREGGLVKGDKWYASSRAVYPVVPPPSQARVHRRASVSSR